MADTVVGTAHGTRADRAPWRAALLVLAVGQFVSPVFTQLFGGAFTTSDRPGEPPIVPAGWAFSIWFAVEVLCFGYAVWALPASRPDRELRDRLAVPLTVVFAGFSLWLVAAEVEPLWLTVLVFAVMVAALLRALRIALDARAVIAAWRPLPRALLWGTLGLYAGWSTIAVWVNLATALGGSGAPVTGPVGVAGQLAILAGAAASAVAVLRWTGGLLPYAAACVWGLTASAVGGFAAGQPVLGGTAAGAVAVVGAAAVWFRLRRA